MTDSRPLDDARAAMIDDKNALDRALACDDPEQAITDMRYLEQNYVNRMRVYLEALEKAYKHELALKEAYSEGWRTRVKVGYLFAWSSMEQHERWNDAANKNPHKYNSDLYLAWQRGFIDNDRAKIFTALTLFDVRRYGRRAAVLEADNERQREQVAQLTGALKPFAQMYARAQKNWEQGGNGDTLDFVVSDSHSLDNSEAAFVEAYNVYKVAQQAARADSPPDAGGVT